MNQIKAFDLSRVGLLIKKEIFYQRRAPWIIIAAVFLMLLIFNLLMASESPGPNDLPSNQVMFYIFTLLILGPVFTSSAFNELNNKSSAHHYLSIPASALEKLLSKWLVTGIFFVVVFNVFYFLFCIMSNFLTEAIFSEGASMFSPFEKRSEINDFRPWFVSQLYLALHTVYLAGAIYFRKYAYFKTMIAQSFISFTLIGLTAAVAGLFFLEMNGSGGFGFLNVQETDGLNDIFRTVLPTLAKTFLWVIFPLWMLGYGLFKLKETEV